ncbi:MAG: M1 family metallopeptidase [Melioribacteraceae bacterium]|nr:M1 family metallopeptidase [Melioribacteraceae bacterium]MCF8263158.1 M1 family metallopeptidase [Melioribacteraceae bacterium]MCF8430388.1 M1 family metallopeptidase [Melioribacteraceae bacterium]
MHRKILFLILMLSATILFSQKLYTPRNIQAAYDNGTRTLSGTPGENYWQNSADYLIKAEIFPDTSMLKGNVKIKYHNNSPDSLDRIIFRLYPNITAKGSARDWSIGTTELLDPVEVSNIVVNEKEYELSTGWGAKVSVSGTNLTIRLKEKIAPNSTSEISMDYQFFIPKIIRVRMGNYGNGELYVAYWYPQVSVYDDIDGWDTQNYSGSVEFYNDFNNFQYEITVPAGHVVIGAGVQQNMDETYQSEIISKYKNALRSDETVRIITADDWANNAVTKSGDKLTYVYKAESVPDVSFIVTNNFLWDGASVEVEKGRRVLTAVVYEDSTVHYDMAAQYSRRVIEYMSKELPGYPYPWPHVTSFSNGGRGGGMEAPMMANNGAPSELGSHVGLIFHEIAHSYLPFHMGTNERKYAWMDEGWASFYPREVVEEYVPDYSYMSRYVSSYEEDAGLETELPMMIPSYSNKGLSRTAFYSKPATAYYQLYKLLGRDLFKEANLEYMERWNEKHPLPWDFFYTFNDVTGEDLSWFWKPWFFGSGYPDLAIDDVKTYGDIYSVKIENRGSIPTRIVVTFKYEDGTQDVVEKSAREWKTKSVTFVNQKVSKKLKEIVLGDSTIPDTFKENNVFNMK